MFDKDRRRIIRATSNPTATVYKLEALSRWVGVTPELLAALLLETIIEHVWTISAIDACDPMFKIDCLCCSDPSSDELAGQESGLSEA